MKTFFTVCIVSGGIKSNTGWSLAVATRTETSFWNSENFKDRSDSSFIWWHVQVTADVVMRLQNYRFNFLFSTHYKLLKKKYIYIYIHIKYNHRTFLFNCIDIPVDIYQQYWKRHNFPIIYLKLTALNYSDI